MKKFFKCMIISVFAMFCLVFSACNSNDGHSSEIKVSFDTLKTICSDDVSKWNGVSVNSLGTKQSSFVSSKSNDNQNYSYLYEETNYKVYCDNGIKYFNENGRKYLDENLTAYDDIINQILEDNVKVVRDFFQNAHNSNKLISSEIKVVGNTTQYMFEIIIDSLNNKTIVVTYTFDEDNLLIKIEINYGESGTDNKYEISRNGQIVTTPEWFDDNDYKSPMQLSEIKNLATNYELTKDWEGAKINFPAELSYFGKDVFVAQLGNEYYQVIDGSQTYCDDSYAYISHDGKPFNKIEIVDFDKRNYIQETQQIFGNLFQESGGTYVAAKKYFKDITIASYKFVSDNPVQNYPIEVICSLYFDLSDNMYKLEAYIKILLDQNDLSNTKSVYVVMTKEEWVEPKWFNKSDFDGFVTKNQIITMMSNNSCNILANNFIFNSSISFKLNENSYSKEHVNESLEVFKNSNGYYDFISTKTISTELLESIKENSASLDICEFYNNNQLMNQKVLCKDQTEYKYVEGLASSKTQNSSNSYLINIYNSPFQTAIISLVKGQFLSQINLPGDCNFADGQLEIVRPGQTLNFQKCVYLRENDLDKYTIIYETQDTHNVVLEYTMYFNNNGDIVKCVATSPYAVSINNSVTTFTFTSNLKQYECPDWFDAEDFI